MPLLPQSVVRSCGRCLGAEEATTLLWRHTARGGGGGGGSSRALCTPPPRLWHSPRCPSPAFLPLQGYCGWCPYLNKWITFTASIAVALCCGLPYAFSIWSGALKNAYNLDQQQLELVAAAANVGGYRCGHRGQWGRAQAGGPGQTPSHVPPVVPRALCASPAPIVPFHSTSAPRPAPILNCILQRHLQRPRV